MWRGGRCQTSNLHVLAVDGVILTFETEESWSDLETDAILLDFSKTFDKVPHHLLLTKLQYYGSNSGQFLNMLETAFV